MRYSNAVLTTSCVTLATVFLLALVFPATTQAQSQGLQVDIPFQFYVGEHLYSPGTYAVRMTGTGGAVSISDGRGQSAVSLTHAAQRPGARRATDSVLIFKVYGGTRYFLSEIRWEGYSDARALPTTTSELQLAKATQEASTTSIAAR